MDPALRPRRLLNLLDTRHGGRSRMTCEFRCGNQCDHPVPNESDNEYFRTIAADAVSRRGLFKAGAGAGLVVGMSGVATASATADTDTGSEPAADGALTSHRDTTPPITLDYPSVPPNTLDTVVVPNGYDWEVVIRWGDPVETGAPEFDITGQSAEAQAKQFGYNCDFLAMLPLRGGSALLVVNHEYTDEVLMFSGYTDGDNAGEEEIKIAMAAHGLSVVEIERARNGGRWVPRRRSRFNRRVHTASPMRLTGAAAGSDLLTSSLDPTGTKAFGTLNNCAGGTTPWGTTLHGEENFHQYFVNAENAPPEYQEGFVRYGMNEGFTGRRWDRVDSRFDLGNEPKEAHRHGWIVELDPYDPRSTPRKHTALGRFKHEGATVSLADDGRTVAYMGDDERFDYMYKFVSSKTFKPGGGPRARRHNLTLLEDGTLYVAKFTGDSPASEIDGTGTLPSDGEFDGTGEWIPLVSGDQSHVPGMTAAEVLVNTRLAADQVGATKMDRPEDVQRNEVTGRVYAALTNNSERGFDTVDEANPLAQSHVEGGDLATGNRNGQVLELEEQGNDAGALAFSWRLFLVCGDPEAAETYFGGFPKDQVSPISSPDNVAFDSDGNLWVSTDGNKLGSNDGLFSVPVEGENRGRLKQFLTVPVGAETCGPLIADDGRSLFVAVQHPGEVSGSTVDDPASTWPDGTFPRPSVVVAWNKGTA